MAVTQPGLPPRVGLLASRGARSPHGSSGPNPPDWTRTILPLGDIHVGAIDTSRTTTATASLNALTAPLALVQIGDMAEPSGGGNDTAAVSFLNGLPGTTKQVVIGNHDMRLTATSRDGDAAALAYGFNTRNWTLDLGFARLIGASPLTWEADGNITLDQIALDFITAQASGTALPVHLLIHAPPPATVTTAGAGYSSFTASFAIDPWPALHAILAANANIKTLIGGHTHSDPSLASAFTMLLPATPDRAVLVINTSALRGTNNPAQLTDPLTCVFVTHTATDIEVRAYDLTARAWLWLRTYPLALTLPTAFASDDFVGADNQTLQTRTNWNKHPNSAIDAVTTSNMLRSAGGGNPIYYRSEVPASADYDVSALSIVNTDNGSSSCWACARMDTTAATYLGGRYDTVSDAYQLFQVVGGTSTQLGSNALGVGGGLMTVRARGNQASLLVGDTEVVAPQTTSVTGTGRPGIRFTGTSGAGIGTALKTFRAVAA